jgi:hypothetical protein
MDSKLLLPLWVVASIVVNAAVTSWLYRGDGQRAEALEGSALGGLLLELGALLYTVGVPFVALLSGTLSLDLMGLGQLWSLSGHTAGFTPAEWLRGAGEAAGAALLALAVLWASRRGAGLADTDGAFAGLVSALRDEAHWMFYRAPVTLLSNDAFYGAIGGIALMAFEWLLHPRFISQHLARERRWHLLTRLICALVSGTLYLGTRNFWLMLAADALIRVLAERMLRAVSLRTA